MYAKTVWTGVLIGLAMFGANIARGGALPELSAVRTDKPPVIDGQLDDACWQGLDAAKRFTFGFEAQTHPVQTRVFVTYDEKALYVAFECDEPNVKGMTTTATNGMDVMRGDDFVDLFLAPQQDDLYQIAANAAGVLFTKYEGPKADIEGYGKITKDIRVAAGIGKDKWVCEFALPFAELRIRPQAGGIWRMNLTRCRMQSERTESSWSPDMGNWKDKPTYGYLKGITFGTKYADQVPPVMLLKAALDEEHAGPVCARLTLLARQAGPCRVTTESLAPNGEKLAVSTNLTLNVGTNECSVSGYITPGAGEHAISFDLVSAGKSLFRSMPLYVSLPKVMDVFTDRNYYTTETNAFLNVNLDAGMKDALGELALEFKLDPVVGGHSGSVQRVEKLMLDNRIGIPLANVAAGEYILSLTLLRNGKSLEIAATPLEKLPPAAQEVKVDRERQILLVNGAPFYARHWEVQAQFYNPAEYGRILDELAADGANHVILFAPELGITNTIAFLDEAQKRNIKVTVFWEILQKQWKAFIGFAYHSASYLKMTGRTKAEQFDLILAEIDGQIDRIKDHPALLAYHLIDEPTDTVQNRKSEGRIITAIRKHDKYHPCFTSYCRIVRIMPKDADTQLIDDTTRYYDYVGVHLFWGSIGGPDAINIMYWWSRMARDTRLKLHRPVFQQMQGAMHSGGGRERTPSEHRMQAYTWIMQGNLAGIGYFTYDPKTESIPIHPLSRAEYRQLVREYQVLAPILTTPELPVSLVNNDNSPIQVIARVSGEKLYLVTANFSQESHQATYAGDFLVPGSQVRNLFSGEKLAVTGNSFQDRIGYQDSRVYEITGWSKAASLSIRLADTILEKRPDVKQFFAESGSGAYYLKGLDAIMVYGPSNTLASVAQAISNATLFSYDPQTRVATCPAQRIRVDLGGELILGAKHDPARQETLKMTSAGKGESYKGLYCDGFLKVYNSTLDLGKGSLDPLSSGQIILENATLTNGLFYTLKMAVEGKPDAQGKITTTYHGSAFFSEVPAEREAVRQQTDFSAFGYDKR